jgi:hypothetical protein
MIILTKYYGSMKLEIYLVGTKYRYVLRKSDNRPILKPSAYESSLPVCLIKVENWIMNEGHTVYTT